MFRTSVNQLPTNSFQAPRRWFPAAVLLAGLGLTLFATFYAAHSVRIGSRAEFHASAQQLRWTINTRMETYVTLLRGLAGFFAAETNISKQSFSAYVNRLRLETNYPGIHGIGYSARLAAGEEVVWKKRLEAEGQKNFHLWPASAGPEYHSIVYLEPETPRNQAAIGYDMFTDPVRREAMERARDLGFRAASGKVILVQEMEGEKQPGFLIYAPVYKGGNVPDSLAERQQLLQGFVYCPFRIGDLVTNVLGSGPLESMKLEIYDGAPTSEHLFFSSNPEPAPRENWSASTSTELVLDVAGRPWTIILHPKVTPADGGWIPLVVLSLGTLLTLALFYLTQAEKRARRRAEETTARLQVSEKALRNSEARQRLIVESALDYAIFSMDLNGTVTSWNSGAERMFGFPESEILGQKGDLIFTPEDRAAGAPQAELAQASKHGFARDDRWHQMKNGSRIFVSGVVRPMNDDSGNRRGFIKIARDVTERLQANEQLQSEKEFSETIINSLPGAFYLFDQAGKFLRWNENLELVSGYSKAEIAQHTPLDFFRGPDQERVTAAIQTVIATGQSSVEAELVTKDGRRIPYLFFGRRIVIGEKPCVMGLGVDISERKRAEQELHDAEERLRDYTAELEHRVADRTANLRQSLQSLEGLLYHVAHDLRAPLRSMASFTKILLDEYASKLDEQAQDYARRIATSAHFMDELVQGLLAYGHLTHAPVHLSKVNLEMQVDAAIEQFSSEIEQKRAMVEIQRPLPSVKANTGVMSQIILNLIANALKFVPAERKPQVLIRAEKDGKVRLWIEDNGIGIKPEYHERIFRIFERLHGGNTYPGTGIGLAIVSKGVERMGGKAGVESVPGQGSRFWVELPAAD